MRPYTYVYVYAHDIWHTQVWAAAYGRLDEGLKAALQKTVGAN